MGKGGPTSDELIPGTLDMLILKTVMRRLGAFYRRLLGLAHRRRLERDLDDELAFHLAMRETEHRESGLPQDRARVAARRQFGSVTLLKEQARDAWTFPSFESWVQD